MLSRMFFCLLIVGCRVVTLAQTPLSNPTALRSDIAISRVIGVPHALASRMAWDASTQRMYYATYSGQVRVIKNFLINPTDSLLFTSNQHGISNLFGLLVKGNAVYVSGSVFNSSTKKFRSYIKKAVLQNNGTYVWRTVASTPAYPAAKFFNHLFSGITFNPAGDTIIVCSGSRGDHGEVDSYDGKYPNLRSTPLASIVLKIPADSININLPNDLAQLAAQGRILAKGVRNTYDFAYNSRGELFGAENSGDADASDEINWIREGKHYGYPWMMGGNWNPQYFSTFNPTSNVMIPHSSYAYASNLFYNDPTFPAPPQSTKFMMPCANLGPDADMLRDTATGAIVDASASNKKCYTLTSHRSPLGLVFDTDSLIGCDLKGDGFVLSWSRGDATLQGFSTLLSPFADNSEDLLQLEFTKNNTGTNYNVVTKKIVTGFWHPVDAVQIQNTLYVLESGDSTEASIWAVTMPAPHACAHVSSTTKTETYFGTPSQSDAQVIVYPNPAHEYFTVENIDMYEDGHITIYDSNGKLIWKGPLLAGPTLINTAEWSAGLYVAVITNYNQLLAVEKITVE